MIVDFLTENLLSVISAAILGIVVIAGIGCYFYKSKGRSVFPMIEIPRDEEGFVQSFRVDQADEIKAFFDEYGLVVVRDVLSATECRDSIDELLTELEVLSKPFRIGEDESTIAPRVNRNDPTTWENSNWPKLTARIGVLGHTPATGLQAWKNRLNDNIYNIFSTIYGLKTLWVQVDRWGVMRPTRDVDMGNGVIESKPEWKTQPVWAHWDMDPWIWSESKKQFESLSAAEQTRKRMDSSHYQVPLGPSQMLAEGNDSLYVGYPKLQGLVALLDSTEEDGGFLAVVGFNKYIERWAKANQALSSKSNFGHFVNVPEGDPLLDQLQKITMRAGSMVIWSSTLPHCNYPNNSNRFRMCQYIKMIPAVNDPNAANVRSELVRMHLPMNSQERATKSAYSTTEFTDSLSESKLQLLSLKRY